MKTVQLAISDPVFAQKLRNLLVRDGSHQVAMVDQPDVKAPGVIVVDDSKILGPRLLESDPERFVVLTRSGTDRLSRIWEAGVRHVVFEKDPPNTAQLAVIAAELRLAQESAPYLSPLRPSPLFDSVR